MLMKFGKLVELEVLQTLSGNRKVEEMRQEVRERDAKNTQELKHWEVHWLKEPVTLSGLLYTIGQKFGVCTYSKCILKEVSDQKSNKSSSIVKILYILIS